MAEVHTPKSTQSPWRFAGGRRSPAGELGDHRTAPSREEDDGEIHEQIEKIKGHE